MKVSRFGRKIQNTSGISQLMSDLGLALRLRSGQAGGEDVVMLGGGNPSHIPEVERALRERMTELMGSQGEFERVIGNYDPPQGNGEFIEAMSELLRRECGWRVTPKNIALTTGSQSAFFILFNIFAGVYEDGTKKKILFPLAPEYIGYCDVGLDDDLFTANRPEIEQVGERMFKYHIDFDRLEVTEEIGAICVSRPTNPTANVLTDAEVGKLGAIARANNIPLIIDNAYGPPFPNITFADVKPVWDENTIVCMSLSKFGLPAVRTGIVIASEEVIAMVSEMNAVMTLGTGSIGAALAMELVRSGEIIRLSREVIRPYYQNKANEAVEQLCKLLNGIDFRIHKPEGAFFLWLWLPGLSISDVELYKRLKQRGVVIVPGHYFFPGIDGEWRHKQECIRISYALDSHKVHAGLEIIAEEIKRVS